MKPLFKQYLINGMVQADTASLAKMCAYFIFYRIPYPLGDKANCMYPEANNCLLYLIRTLFYLCSIFSEFDTMLFYQHTKYYIVQIASDSTVNLKVKVLQYMYIIEH